MNYIILAGGSGHLALGSKSEKGDLLSYLPDLKCGES